MEGLLQNLNEKQMEAVRTTQGPVLIIAGAGSGKTTVLVNRIAYMIGEKGIDPATILAITFTNKAANELKSRIEGILGGIPRGMWVGTFHSICVRILRSTIDLIGIANNFTIYDTADCETVLKECMKELNIEEKGFPVKTMHSYISDAKNNMIDPETYEYTNRGDYRKSIVSAVYKKYQSKLRKNNALDFDDIIFYTVHILSLNPDVLARYQNRFQYIMIDEYQDTDNSQYLLVKMLAQGYENLCVVGDDDQSIYKFRGANVENILGFEEDYPSVKKIVLDQNYRSTENILNAANAVIGHNKRRMGKKLWSQKGEGEKICSFTGENEKSEGRFIAKEIKKQYEKTGKYSDCAILYRTNVQSRALEAELLNLNIPYKVLSGLRFFDRKEIKDITAYLRVINNPHDDVSLRRIINEPKRKIGNTTVNKLQAIADDNDTSIYNIILHADMYDEIKSASSKLRGFVKIIEALREEVGKLTLSELVVKTGQISGYVPALELENTIESRTRLENLEEFMTVVKEFETSDEYEGTLEEFLESVTLVSSVDQMEDGQDCVVMMTVHSAKGLEFPVVFLAGFEERLFPSSRSTQSTEELEEERRLCYVAMTRAKEKLFITKTKQRFIFGKTEYTMPSRFYDEVPKEYIEEKEDAPARVMNYAEKMGVQVTRNRPSQQKSAFLNNTSKTSAHKVKGTAKRFMPGERVLHDKFGAGTIMSVQPYSTGYVLKISFDDGAQKTILSEFAKLKKL